MKNATLNEVMKSVNENPLHSISKIASREQLEIIDYHCWSLLGLVDEIIRLREIIKEMEDYE